MSLMIRRIAIVSIILISFKFDIREVDTHLDTLLRIQSSLDVLDCLVRSIRLSQADASHYERVVNILRVRIDDLDKGVVRENREKRTDMIDQHEKGRRRKERQLFSSLSIYQEKVY